MNQARLPLKFAALGVVILLIGINPVSTAEPGAFNTIGGTYRGLLTYADNVNNVQMSGPGMMKVRLIRKGHGAKVIVTAKFTTNGTEFPFKSVFQFRPNGQMRIPAGLFNDPTVPAMQGNYKKNGPQTDYEARFRREGRRWTVVGELRRFPEFPGTASLTAASLFRGERYTSFVFNTTPPNLKRRAR